MYLRTVFMLCIPILGLASGILEHTIQHEEKAVQESTIHVFKEDRFSSSNAPLRVPFKSTKVLHSELPKYPDLAKIRGDQGDVLVEVWVDEAGTPIKTMTVWGLTLLQKNAETCAKQWRFVPYSKNGKAVPVRFRVKFDFKLEKGRPYEFLPPRYDD